MPTAEAKTVNLERLARVDTLKSGSHPKPNGEFAACVMEAVAYVAGVPWSDHPACTCPVITTFMVAWNDGLPSDADRTRLLLPLVLETDRHARVGKLRGYRRGDLRRPIGPVCRNKTLARESCRWPGWRPRRRACVTARPTGLASARKRPRPGVAPLRFCARRQGCNAAGVAAWDAAGVAACIRRRGRRPIRQGRRRGRRRTCRGRRRGRRQGPPPGSPPGIRQGRRQGRRRGRRRGRRQGRRQYARAAAGVAARVAAGVALKLTTTSYRRPRLTSWSACARRVMPPSPRTPDMSAILHAKDSLRAWSGPADLQRDGGARRLLNRSGLAGALLRPRGQPPRSDRLQWLSMLVPSTSGVAAGSMW